MQSTNPTLGKLLIVGENYVCSVVKKRQWVNANREELFMKQNVKSVRGKIKEKKKNRYKKIRERIKKKRIQEKRKKKRIWRKEAEKREKEK